MAKKLGLLVLILVIGVTLIAPAFVGAQGSRYFPETGYTVSGDFLTFFDTYGGSYIFGYPITNAYYDQQLNRQIQYFQKARMELWPQNPWPHRVQLGLLGDELGGGTPRVSDWTTPGNPNQRYFVETGHAVTNAFLDFFDRYGGVQIFGYPISEASWRGGAVIQYFQRSRMEWRNDQVQLGNVGSERLGSGPVPPGPYPTPTSGYPSNCQSFGGYNVCGAFLNYFNTYGGVSFFGYPISNEFAEGGRTVQCFQNAKMELVSGYTVQLSAAGQQVYGHVDAGTNDWCTAYGGQFFPETGHCVTNAFLDYFNQHGGLNVFGHPISEAQYEGANIVQWFRNLKMVWNGSVVTLANLGSQVCGGQPGPWPTPTSWWQPTPTWGNVTGAFGQVWNNNATVRQRLGSPTAAQVATYAAKRDFQRGIMFWRDDTRMIYALVNTNYTWQAHGDTWADWMPPYTDLQPQPGNLWPPDRGFGKVWREQLGGPYGPLGWSTEPSDIGYSGLVQNFQHGLMWLGNDGAVYVLYNDGTWNKF